MDLLQDRTFKQTYKKCKYKVKMWESEFLKITGRNPSKIDIRNAPTKIRDAYKLYYKLKTQMLETTLMDITFGDEDTLDTTNTMNKICVDNPTALSESNTIFLDTEKSKTIRTVLKDIQNDNDHPAESSKESSIQSSKHIPAEGSHKYDSKVENFQDVWGVRLSKSLERKSSDKQFSLHQRSSSFNLSQKLFVGSKFSTRNPRKSKSFSRPSKVYQSDGFPVDTNSTDTLPPVIVGPFVETSAMANNSVEQSDSAVFNIDVDSLVGKQLEPKVVMNSAPLFSQPVSVLQKVLYSEHKVTPTRTFNQGWLDRCSQLNSLEKPPVKMSDSGYESMELSSVNIRNLTTNTPPTEDSFLISNKSLMIPDDDDVIYSSDTELDCSNTSTLTQKRKLLDLKIINRQLTQEDLKPAKIPKFQGKDLITNVESTTDTENRQNKLEVPLTASGNGACDQMNNPPCNRTKRSSSKARVSRNANKSRRLKNSVTEDSDCGGHLTDEENGLLGSFTKQKQNNTKTQLRNKSHVSQHINASKKLKMKTENKTSQNTLKNGDDSEDIPDKEAVLILPAIADDIDKIADEIVSKEKKCSGDTTKKSKKLSKRELLEKKMASGTANDNFVKIDLKKKVYVRGKKHTNFSKYKKREWKKKKAAKSLSDLGGCDGGILTCFNCGDVGHFASRCLKSKGDELLPQEDEEVSPFPTLEEVEAMVVESECGRSLKCDASTSTGQPIPPAVLEAMTQDLPCNVGGVPSIYKLQDDGSLIDTPLDVLDALVRFGHTSFRPGQEIAVMRILSGMSTLVTLSTGAGKSLCYQLPAYLYSRKSPCITLVISPLVSLMEDQVTGVPDCLRAACLHTNQTQKQRERVLEMAQDGSLNILLVSPEAVVSGEKVNTGFGKILRQLPPIAFACIDEAHCVSQWSHNFRPSYLMICQVLREKLGVRTVLGLTATATKATCASIVEHLQVPDGEHGVIRDTPLPSNLLLSVSKDENRDRALITLLKGNRFKSCHSVIVYCTRREECERLASLLRTCLQDISKPENSSKRGCLSLNAEAYHAGLSAARRRRIQSAFMSGQLRIVVATVAFGMGINKHDIRAIIHFNMPKSFESYVQEVGRAGRDGLPAHCHLFLDSEGRDQNELRRHIHANSVDRHVIRKLLQRVFVPCKCGSEVATCPSHEVAFEVDGTIQALDLPQENITTMLCYLELHPKNWIKLMSPVYTHCKVLSYKGPAALKAAARLSPPLAMAVALDQRRGISHDKSNIIEFPVVDIAAAINWDSGLVKNHLKNLEWTKVNGHWKRTGLTAQFSNLGFRVKAPGNLGPSDLDEALDTLYERVEREEHTKLKQLQVVFQALTSVAHQDCLSCCDNIDEGRSEQLKRTIRKYFQQETIDVELPNEMSLANEAQVAADIRSLVCSYKDVNFTGRAVARIFHGISSPCFPAPVWGSSKFWRAHLQSSFKLLCKVATQELLRMR